jgi:FdhD protein
MRTNNDLFKTFHSFTRSADRFSRESSDLIVEAPLEIIINEERHVLIMFTPQMIRELIVGFIFTEGLISSISEIAECNICPVNKPDGEQVIEARVTISSQRSHARGSRDKRISYSSCGICGRENFYDLKSGLGRVKSRHRFSLDIIKRFLAGIQDLQPLYGKTGGAHAAILIDAHGKPVLHCEDMGRHNALDKVIGGTLMRRIGCEDKILVSSGRASLEMILKLARAEIPVFVAMSRPTSRAVEAAKFYNVTLVDMAKCTNRIYSHARRIEGF